MARTWTSLASSSPGGASGRCGPPQQLGRIGGAFGRATGTSCCRPGTRRASAQPSSPNCDEAEMTVPPVREATDPRRDTTERRRAIEVVIDEDGYTELRYWPGLNITPTEAVAIITSVLAATTAAQDSVARIVPARQARVGLAGYDGAVTECAGEGGMPGPQDHVAEQERTPDPARPREPDHPREAPARSTDLQGRLERLPVGHPSSPYRDDGSRKPSPPDLGQYELPLPDELPSDSDQPDSRLPPGDAPHVGPDGSWRWKGRDLPPEQSRMADQAVAKCRDTEGRNVDGNYGRPRPDPRHAPHRSPTRPRPSSRKHRRGSP